MSDGFASSMRRFGRIPKGIWALGFVSMLMDISSEMIHALLPVYLVSALGASMTMVGTIEGIAESTAAITKLFSGVISDRLQNRKTIAALGYGLAALTKPIFPLAVNTDWIVAARFIDRIGKGVRGAPRDALVADISPAELRGASFGLRQSLDTIGAFVGPLLAIVLMWSTRNQFTLVFWVAVIPAFLAVLVLLVGVREPSHPERDAADRRPFLREVLALGPASWSIVVLGGIFSLARFSEAFLVLRANEVGLPIVLTPLVLVVMNVVYAVAAYPAGVLSDRMDRLSVLAYGILFLILADIAFARFPSLVGIGAGLTFWGLHLGFSQGILASLLADVSPPHLRGTAFGIFNLVGGVALFAASLIAGGLWDRIGAEATFAVGGGLAFITLLGTAAFRVWRTRAGEDRRDG